MDIAHLDRSGAPKPSLQDNPKPHWKVIPHPIEPRSGIEVAQLQSVSWLDVQAVFRPQDLSSVPAGSYQVQWRLNYMGAHPDSVFAGTTFRAVVFNKDEATVQERQPSISFQPQSAQELMDQTDRPGSIPAWPTTLQEALQLEAQGYDQGAQGFFTLVLPGKVQLDAGGGGGGVLVQIQNHDR
ncbi:hypothetical protein BGX31_006601 [Mortierella sp. GBA43]|nr:hypothetical protein BGX31_006601 [Mortierella sp. GBA43]